LHAYYDATSVLCYRWEEDKKNGKKEKKSAFPCLFAKKAVTLQASWLFFASLAREQSDKRVRVRKLSENYGM